MKLVVQQYILLVRETLKILSRWHVIKYFVLCHDDVQPASVLFFCTAIR